MMWENLEQLDPNYVVSLDYSKENVAQLVSQLDAHGLPSVARPGHNSKTIYIFTRVEEPGVLASGEAFTKKHGKKKEYYEGSAEAEKQAQQNASIRSLAPESVIRQPGSLSDPQYASSVGRASDLGGLREDDLVKGGKQVLGNSPDSMVDAGKKAAESDNSELGGAGKKAAADAANQLDREQIAGTGKHLFSGDKTDIVQRGKEAVVKNELAAGGGGKDPKGVAIDAGKEFLGHKYGVSAVPGSGYDSDFVSEQKTSAVADDVPVGGRATLFAIVANFDFAHSVTPIYDIEKRKKLDSTIDNLVQASCVTPSDRDLLNLEHLTRNPRKILYFFFFKNYIRWLLPLSFVGVVCRLFSRSSAPWEFNITYTVVLIAWSLLFTGSWIYYFEPLYAGKLGKVLGTVAPSYEKLSPPHVVLFRKLCFVPVALLFGVAVVLFQLLCFFIEIFITQLYSGPFGSVLALLPTGLISAFVPVITLLYNRFFVEPMVKWENGPNPKKSKSEKNYVVTFLTSYVPLFITLYVYLPLGHKFTPDMKLAISAYAGKFHVPVVASQFVVDIGRYRKQFFFYTVTAQIMSMVVENALPLALDALVPAFTKDGDRTTEEEVAKIDSVVQSRYPQDFKLWKKVQSLHASNYGEFDEDSNYSKLVVQFGYIAMFSTIWPLAPLIFTIFDLIVFRADLWRAFIKCKPSSNPADFQVSKGGAHKVHVSSVPWNGILEKITYLGSVVSVTLLLMYRYSTLPGVGLATALEKRDSWHEKTPLAFSWSRILLISGTVEHLALLGYVYFKDVLLSYQTKFDPVTLPTIRPQKSTFGDEVQETAALMDAVINEPEIKEWAGTTNAIGYDASVKGSSSGHDHGNDETNIARSSDFPTEQSHASTSGFNDGFKDGMVDARKDSNRLYAKNMSKSGSMDSSDHGGEAANNVSPAKGNVSARIVSDGSLGVNRSRSTKRSSIHSAADAKGRTNDKSPRDPRHHHHHHHHHPHSSAKELNSSALGDNKGTVLPFIVADSPSREIPVQSQGKVAPKSPSKNLKNPDDAPAAAGVVAGEPASTAVGPGHVETGHSSPHPVVDTSFGENSILDDDAGATLPETIPTSKNYSSRYDKSGRPIKHSVVDASPSGSPTGGSAIVSGGGSAGGEVAAGDASDVAANDMKSDKAQNVSALRKDLKQDVGNGFSGNDLSKALKGDNADDADQSVTKSISKDISVAEAMKTLDPSVFATSAANTSNDPSSIQAEGVNLAKEGAPVDSAVFAARSKRAVSGASSRGAEHAAVSVDRPKSIHAVDVKNEHSTPSAAENAGVKNEGSHGKQTSRGVSRDASSAQGTDFEDNQANKINGAREAARTNHDSGVHHVADANTTEALGTTHAAGDADATGTTAAAAVAAPAVPSARKTPGRSATKSKAETPRSKAASPPSRSKTLGHSSHSKEATAQPKPNVTNEVQKGSVQKGPKSRSSNPELRSKQANNSSDSKSKHKSGLLHRIIKKLE